jgi:hypothetical protein
MGAQPLTDFVTGATGLRGRRATRVVDAAAAMVAA